MDWIFLLVAVVVLIGAVAIVKGKTSATMPEPVVDRPFNDLPEGWLTVADIENVEFRTALRGYEPVMVDEFIERLTREIAERDELIAQLRENQPSAD